MSFSIRCYTNGLLIRPSYDFVAFLKFFPNFYCIHEVRSVQSRRRWWCYAGGPWSVIGQSVLVVLLAVTCQCQRSVDRRVSAIQRSSSSCRTVINGTVIDLGRLHHGYVAHRYLQFSSVQFSTIVYVRPILIASSHHNR